MATGTVIPPAPAVSILVQGKDEFKALLSRYQMLPFEFAIFMFLPQLHLWFGYWIEDSDFIMLNFIGIFHHQGLMTSASFGTSMLSSFSRGFG
jgi:hypothetical protein